MTTAMEDLMKKFEGVELMVTQMLDKLMGLEAWRSSPEEATRCLLSQAERVVSRLQRLEVAPLPPPPPHQPPRPSTAPPLPPSRWMNQLDLNMAPHQEARPCVPSWERPNEHRVATTHRDVGGGILGSQPPHPITGMFSDPSLSQFLYSESARDFPPRFPTSSQTRISKIRW